MLRSVPFCSLQALRLKGNHILSRFCSDPFFGKMNKNLECNIKKHKNYKKKTTKDHCKKMAKNLQPINLKDVKSCENWLDRFFLYAKTNKDIDKKNETAYYLTFAGEDAYLLLKDLAFPAEISAMPPKSLHKLLLNHIRPPRFETTERAKFHKITREDNEGMKAFILRLQQQASNCNFGNQLQEQLRDRIVAGVNSAEIERKLLEVSELTYKKAVEILENSESIGKAVTETGPVLATKIGKEREIEPFKKKYSPGNNKFRRPTEFSRSRKLEKNMPKGPCYSCGGNHFRVNCEFRRAKCHSCHQEGHIARVCKKKTSGCFLTKGGRYITEQIIFQNGKEAQFIVDTGSPLSLVPRAVYKEKLGSLPLEKESETIQGITGHRLEVLGSVKVRMRTKEKNEEAVVKLIVTETGPCLLGLDALNSLRLSITFHVSETYKARLPEDLYRKISHGGELKGGMKIEPIDIECSAPATFFKARNIPFGQRDAVEAHLKELESEGTISKVGSNSWASPIVIATKSNGQLRICGDYRIGVNKHLHQRATTTKEIDAILAGIKGSRFFSKVDLKNAFLQIPLTDSASRLTVVNTPFGLYKYNFLPFGLTCSPAIFQEQIDKIIEGIPNTVAYQDDVLVFSSTERDHIKILHQLVDRLLKYNVRINTQKSTFLQGSIGYLGYTLTADGLSPDPAKVAPLVNSPVPNSVEALKSFLGAIQYYSRFIPHLSTTAAPLYNLLGEEQFRWNESHSKARQQLLNVITAGPVLQCFDPKASSTLTVDSSSFGLGAVLEQGGKPVIFISRKLNVAESHYSQTQKEALAVVWAVKRLHKFLYGKPFAIVTDHKALTYIFNPDKGINGTTTSMLTRWACTLSQYQYTIQHKAGKEIPTADYLSRYSYQQPPPTTIHSLQPFPIDRNKLIAETRKFYGGVLRSLRCGWSQRVRKMFPDLFSRRADIGTSADGVLLHNDCIVCPPILRQPVLQHLHQSHLGRDKMLSMARNLYWWPSIGNDIAAFCRNCETCAMGKSAKPTQSVWPFSFRPMQRVHVDYCGPFLHGYYALVIIDSFSKYPQVYWTKNTDAKFTKTALRRFFCEEGVPQMVVSDNGPQFRADQMRQWLQTIGVVQLFSPARHPQSNGQAENFVRTLKVSINSANPQTTDELFEATDSFLLQYRSSEHATTKKSPAVLFKGRSLRTSASMDLTRVVFKKGTQQQHQPGVVIGQRGQQCVDIVDPVDGSVHVRHRNQIFIPQHHNGSESSDEDRVAAPIIDDNSSSEHSDSSQAVQLRRSTRVRRPPRRFNDFILNGEV